MQKRKRKKKAFTRTRKEKLTCRNVKQVLLGMFFFFYVLNLHNRESFFSNYVSAYLSYTTEHWLNKASEVTFLPEDQQKRLIAEHKPKCRKHSGRIPNQSQLWLHGFFTFHRRFHTPKMLSWLGIRHTVGSEVRVLQYLSRPLAVRAVCGTALGRGRGINQTAHCSSLIGSSVCHLNG